MFWICTDAMIDWSAIAAIGQLILGGAVGYVAIRQWFTAQSQAITARNKLRAELFDRRYAKYQELIGFATTVMHGGSAMHVPIEIQRVRKEMEWIFGSAVSEWVKVNIEKVAFNHRQSEHLVASTERGTEVFKAVVSTQYNQQMQLSENLDQLASLLTPQMNLSE